MNDRLGKNKVTRIEVGAMPAKNILGNLGERCAYCSGAGYTNNINGTSAGCHRCDQTGIEPINTRMLATKVDSLEAKMDKILQLLQN